MFEVISTDGVSRLDKVSTERDALELLYDLKKRGFREAAVYRGGNGFHSTTQTERVVAFFGERSYLVNVAQKDPNLLKKKILF